MQENKGKSTVQSAAAPAQAGTRRRAAETPERRRQSRNAQGNAAKAQSRDAQRKAPPPRRRRPAKPPRRRRRRGAFVALLILVLLALLIVGALLLPDNRPDFKRSYPVEYSDLIYENAALQGVDPAYVASIILAESSYNPNAVSSVNAQGLMQIMPDTGKWLAGKFDEEYMEGCLFDPEVSIRYGSWYLGFLCRRYDGDLTCATAAYHSGQGAVDKWLDDPAYSQDGKTLSEIKGTNAKTYVNRVLEYYEAYSKIYH